MIRRKRSSQRPSIGWYGPIDSHWIPLLNHFSQVEVLDTSSASQWADELTGDELQEDKLLLVGIEHRSDPRLRWLLARDRKVVKKGVKKGARRPSPFKSLLTSESMACVLGEDLGGHRRTYSLPETLETFYWHQWYDRVIPWVCWQGGHGRRGDLPDNDSSKLRNAKSRVEQSASLGLRVGRVQSDADRFEAWRLRQETIANLNQRIAWVISDQECNAHLWHGLIESYGIRTVASHSDCLVAAIQSDLILIDLTDRSESQYSGDLIAGWELPEKLQSFLVNIRQRQPSAFLVMLAPMGSMAQWQQYRSLGVDAIVQRPLNLQGLLCTWGCWLESLGKTIGSLPRVI